MVSVDELLFGICDRDITNVGSTLEHTSRMEEEEEKTAGEGEGGGGGLHQTPMTHNLEKHI